MKYFYRHIIEIEQTGIYGPEYLIEDLREKKRKPLEELSFFRKYPISFKNIQSEATNYNPAEVYLIPINKIFVNKDLFQNRQTDFSERSVNNIINAVETGTFSWQVLDPILLWQDPASGKLYILSGHSRTQAFRLLNAKGMQVDNKDFSSIPAKIIKTDIETAKRIAAESNTLSTKETILERANYYRKLREQGQNERSVIELAKRNEDKNANTIIRLSYLNPTGKAYQNILSLIDSDSNSRSIAITLGAFIGNARMKFSELTDSHENEMYDYLIKMYPGKISDIRTFEQQIYNIIQKRKMFGEFNANEPLNLLNTQKETYFDSEQKRLINEINEQKSLIEKKRKDLISRGATNEQILRILQPEIAYLNRLSFEYQKLIDNKNKIKEESNRQLSLFGIAGIKNIFV